MNKNKLTKTIVKALTILSIISPLGSVKALAYQDDKIYKEIAECKKYGDMYKILSTDTLEGKKVFVPVFRVGNLKEDLKKTLTNKEFDNVSLNSDTEHVKFFKNNEIVADIDIKWCTLDGNDIESLESLLLSTDIFSDRIQSYSNFNKGNSFEVTSYIGIR